MKKLFGKKSIKKILSVINNTLDTHAEVVYDDESMGDYMRKCLETYALDLADMRMGRLPQDDTLFWKAVDTYKSLYGFTDDKIAVKAINSLVNDAMRSRC